jgi:hypothetical protein
MADKRVPPEDPKFDDVIKSGKDDVRLSDLKTYIFDGDLTRRKVEVEVSFALAWGTGSNKLTATPKTIGDLQKEFDNHLAFEDPGGNHNRSQVVVRYQDPKTGRERSERIATAMIYVVR